MTDHRHVQRGNEMEVLSSLENRLAGAAQDAERKASHMKPCCGDALSMRRFSASMRSAAIAK